LVDYFAVEKHRSAALPAAGSLPGVKPTGVKPTGVGVLARRAPAGGKMLALLCRRRQE
jgi:hypothetical protein